MQYACVAWDTVCGTGGGGRLQDGRREVDDLVLRSFDDRDDYDDYDDGDCYADDDTHLYWVESQ